MQTAWAKGNDIATQKQKKRATIIVYGCFFLLVCIKTYNFALHF